MTHEQLAPIVAAIADALARAVVELASGATADDALARAIEVLEDRRAASKFSDYRPG